MKLSKIYIYPIKSLGGIELNEAIVEERGLQHDRRWLLIDADNKFVTQRSHHAMVLIDVKITGNGLRVWHRQKPEIGILEVPFLPQTADLLSVVVWDDTMEAIVVNEASNLWFSKALEADLRLVFMPNTSIRPADAKYAPFENQVSFADGYPYLVVGQASLDDLNGRLQTPVSINHFRPNFVVEGSLPYQEDSWTDFKIGDLAFLGVKPCARCIMTTIDPHNASAGKEPLLTLASYRKQNNKIYFGQNVLAKSYGSIKVGDGIDIPKL